MMYDTDVLIWFIRGNEKAARAFENDSGKCLSIQSYMELLHGARDKEEQKQLRDFIFSFDLTNPNSLSYQNTKRPYLFKYSRSLQVSRP